MTVSERLRGARVRRALALSPASLALELRAPELRGVLLCSAEREAQGFGFTDAAPEPQDRPSALAVLEGHALERFERIGGASVRVLFARRERQQLALVLDGRASGLALIDLGSEPPTTLFQRGKPRIAAAFTPEPYEPAESLDELERDGAALAPQLARLGDAAHRAALLKALAAEHARRERRLRAIEGDIARVAQIEDLRRDASLLLAQLHTIGSASGEVALLDLTGDPPSERVLHIDPKLGAKRQADAWFERARKLQRGALLAEQRAAQTRTELGEIAALQARAENARAGELGALQQAARAFGIATGESSRGPASKRTLERMPYREFRGSGERPIFVGRGASDNDALTLRHSKPHDLWLHARDQSGAHVIVPLARNESCPPELLCDAATLAAHFSGARDQPQADVVYTPRRYIQKPRKAAPGSVLVLREKVFRLELEPQRLKRLLAQEWAPDSAPRKR